VEVSSEPGFGEFNKKRFIDRLCAPSRNFGGTELGEGRGLFIYLYAACGWLATSFSGGAVVPLMQCPSYQHAGTHFADLRG